MKKLLGNTLDELKEIAKSLGMPAFTGTQIAKWIYEKRVTSIDEMTNLSKQNREKLAAEYEVGFMPHCDAQYSKDGTIKYLFPVSTTKAAPVQSATVPEASGALTVETVFIPDHDRATLCVSCQVGCKMNCQFCQTGKQGFQGDLSAGDIINQILNLPEFESLTNYVFMGMGEPMDNYDNIMRVLDIMTSEWGMAMSPTRITVSTSGLIPNMKRFISESKCNLAVSLHSPFHDERMKLMPVENKYAVSEVIHAIRQHDWSGQRRVSFEYIVFKGFNDTQRHVNELARQLGSLRCRVNLIRFHAVPGVELHSPSMDDMVRFRDRLNDKGIIATIRASRGQDIDAACGLLSTKEKNS